MKLLVVDLQNPNETHYHDPNNIDAFMLGRRLSNYPMFVVKDDGTMKKIVVDSADAVEIKKQVLEQLDLLWNSLEYTRATISGGYDFPSMEGKMDYQLIHKGRARHSKSYLNQAIDLVNEMKKELK